jgi:hypothetical protein
MAAKWKYLFLISSAICSTPAYLEEHVNVETVEMDQSCTNALSWCCEQGVVAEDDKRQNTWSDWQRQKEHGEIQERHLFFRW